MVIVVRNCHTVQLLSGTNWQHASCCHTLSLGAVREQILLSYLVLEGHGALWLYIAHDYYPSLWIVPELDREAWNGLRSFRDALLAVDVCVGQESHLA